MILKYMSSITVVNSVDIKYTLVKSINHSAVFWKTPSGIYADPQTGIVNFPKPDVISSGGPDD